MARDFEVQGNNGARPPIVWKDLTTVTQDGTDWAVRVQTNESGRPRYSYEFGKLRDGKFLRFVSADVQTFDGSVSMTPLDITPLTTLLAKAEDAMYQDAQRREDAFQAQRGSRPGGGGFRGNDRGGDRSNDRTEGRGRGKGGRQRGRNDYDRY